MVGIIYEKGDLMGTDISVIAHGCNAQGVMGSGVAKAIKENYPNAYRGYLEAYRRGSLKLGNTIWVDCGDKEIINCITQINYGRSGDRYVDYDGLETCMVDIEVEGTRRFDQSDPNMFEFVAMPMIGAGLGGGNWNIISRIIEKSFNLIQPVVYVF